MAGIMRSANRPKTAKHLRSASQKTFVNRTAEERDRDHAASDAWAERAREAELARLAAVKAAKAAAEQAEAERMAAEEGKTPQT